MNARIKELEKLSIEKVNCGLNGTSTAERFNRKKFAELIIRECVAEIHVADVGNLHAKAYYLDKVAEHIEKRFGVES